MKHQKHMIMMWLAVLVGLVAPHTLDGNGMSAAQKVFKKVLSNGLTILVREVHTIPKVAIQLWYNVGSKDERSGEKGLAHLIEHMIFKGTTRLSESDINLITQKISGSTNAFTSYDYTAYVFDVPSQNWEPVFDMLSDTMRNCRFDEQMLNSELKTVVQELKMYRDSYERTLLEEMIGTMFPDHPYHFPIIGYKQDLWNLQRDTLLAFYLRHYLPNNATLVLVGDVKADDVFAKAESYFSSIEPDLAYVKATHYHHQDLLATRLTLRRDVQHPTVCYAFVMPGKAGQSSYVSEIISLVLGSGKSSRLYRKIVDDLHLATSLQSFSYDLFDAEIFFIKCSPINTEAIATIRTLISQEIEDIVTNGLTQEELHRARKQVQVSYESLFDSITEQANFIGESYLATRNDQALLTYLDEDTADLEARIRATLKASFRSARMHEGHLIPLGEQDMELWQQFQEVADAEDARILDNRERTTSVEPGRYVEQVPVNPPAVFAFPKAETFTLANGLEVLYYHSKTSPVTALTLELAAKAEHDSPQLPGLYSFLCSLFTKGGTTNRPGSAFAHEIERQGMSFSAQPGSISMKMLSSDVPQGIELLTDILTHASFDEKAIEQVRRKRLKDVAQFWETPTKCMGQVVMETMYAHHPYGKRTQGTPTSLNAIGAGDLQEFYRTTITPVGARLAIVGQLEEQELKALLEKTLAQWQGAAVEPLAMPPLPSVVNEEVSYAINRDQTVLAFSTRSVNRSHPDFDKILLFDQIFTGGVLGALSSRLFELREATGMFYTIGGSLLAHSDNQPGIVIIKTIVSNDKLEAAQEAIMETIRTAADRISDEEFAHAQDALINSLSDNFESNGEIANALLFLRRYNLPDTYFDERAAKLLSYSKDEVQEAAQRLLKNTAFVTFKIGRLQDAPALTSITD